MATTAIKERPILFSGPMVRAILDGRKTQTRRVIDCVCNDDHLGKKLGACGLSIPPHQWDGESDEIHWHWSGRKKPVPGDWVEVWQTDVDDHAAGPVRCPYGNLGDRLWVRESLYVDDIHCIDCPPSSWPQTDIIKEQIYYRADGDCCKQIPECSCAEVGKPRWTPSIHMPRWASRITLEITGIRCERLRSISEADAIAEGIEKFHDPRFGWKLYGWLEKHDQASSDPRLSYETLWNLINGPESWAANPFVWVVEFRKES